MTERHAIAVIGAGLVGVCCALSLRRDGHDVTLIEPNDVGSGASYGNAGLMSSGGCVPIGTPGIIWKVPRMLVGGRGPLAVRWSYLPRIAPWLWRLVRASSPDRVERISIALAQLLERAQPAYRALLSGEDYHALIQARGLLFPYKTEASFEGSAWTRDLRRRRGVRFQVLEKAELHQLEPALSSDHRKGVYFPEARHTVDPQKLAQSLARAFVEEQGRILQAGVDSIGIDRSDRPSLATTVGRRRFGKVVLAAGAWSKRLARMCGARVPLDTERGYHAMLPDPGVRLRVPVISGDHSIALTPMAEGLRVSGTVELGGLKAPPNYAIAERMAGLAEQVLPGLRRDGFRAWLGFRPSLPDSLPVIGPAPRTDNVLMAFGHGHLGVTYAAVTGQLIADLVGKRRPAVDLAPYSAARF